MKNKRLYLFYHNDVKRGLVPRLYAYTPTKRTAKIFQQQRDPNMFKMVMHEVSDDIYYKFLVDHGGSLLDARRYYTKSTDIAGYVTKTYIEIVSTSDEEIRSVLEGDKLLDKISEQLNNIGDIFDKPMYKILKNLGYTKTNGIKNLAVDDFAIFLKLYGGTMNADYFNK